MNIHTASTQARTRQGPRGELARAVAGAALALTAAAGIGTWWVMDDARWSTDIWNTDA
jgi:hypothetical protein